MKTIYLLLLLLISSLIGNAQNDEQNYVQEVEIAFYTDSLKFPGTLCLPIGMKNPALAILVHGSGPNDRDETIGPNKPFQDLAHGLAKRGIASLRYEKRTREHSGFVVKNMDQLTLDQETVDDALSAISWGHNCDSSFSAFFIIGHSQGAFAAPRIASKAQGLDGIIMLAGNSRPLEALLIEQYNYIFGLDGISWIEQKQIDQLSQQIENLNNLKTSNDYKPSELPLGLPGNYWLSFKNYDQIATAQNLTLPILILQGEADYQVRMTDFIGWRDALKSNSNVTYKSYPRLNHLFMPTKYDELSQPSDYQYKNNLSAEVIDDIADWIKKSGSGSTVQ